MNFADASGNCVPFAANNASNEHFYLFIFNKGNPWKLLKPTVNNNRRQVWILMTDRLPTCLSASRYDGYANTLASRFAISFQQRRSATFSQMKKTFFRPLHIDLSRERTLCYGTRYQKMWQRQPPSNCSSTNLNTRLFSISYKSVSCKVSLANNNALNFSIFLRRLFRNFGFFQAFLRSAIFLQAPTTNIGRGKTSNPPF